MNASIFESIRQKKIILVAVTKTFPIATIGDAYRVDVRHFGENRVEEAREKIFETRRSLPGIIWHMIGHVQTNKAKEVANLFDWVDSVDSIKIAKKLNEIAGSLNKKLHILIEVNFSGESSRYGCTVFELGELTEECYQLPNIIVEGLMTMPPAVTDPEENRPFFAHLKKLQGTLSHVSMGTSQDYLVAIEEGATMVRIGRALLGKRSRESNLLLSRQSM